MNILEYIDSLIEEGYSEEDAERCADALFSPEWDSEEDEDVEQCADALFSPEWDFEEDGV